MDLWTIGLFFELFFGPFFGLFSKSDFYQKVIFGVGMLFIYGAEEGWNGKMKMASRQWQECYIEGNHKFRSRFSVFACICGGYSNRVKRLRRLSRNFILLKHLLLTKNCLFTIRFKTPRVILVFVNSLFVRWLLNGVIETICSVLKILWSLRGEIRLLIELTYRKEFVTCC